MEEHKITEGKSRSNVLFRILCILGIALVCFGLIYCGIRYGTGEFYQKYGHGYGHWVPYAYEGSGYTYFSLLLCALCFENEAAVGVLIYLGGLCILAGLFVHFMMSKRAITVTDQRVIGADELKKYRELLDSGVITQEEFDAKKKQLLGL